MDAVDVARWQFAITTVYHFLFVPITIGMSLIVAVFHTQWLRTRNPEYYRLTKFFGKLFIINFALGLVTGIVQEFQFGMNWSDYSRFVGDIFGAPLAFEALLAFFLESTFLGIWIFGWGRIPEKLHAGAIWLVHIGTVLSAYFILAANSFMQNPVGYRFNPATGRAEMSDFWAVLTNKVQLVTFPHVVLSAYMVGGGVVMGVALWLLRKHAGTPDESMYRRATRFGAIFALVASLGVIVSGDVAGQDHDRGAADEDGGRRGPVRDHEQRPLLGAVDRLARRQRGHPDHRDPRPALLHGDRQLRRHRRGHQRPQGLRAGDGPAGGRPLRPAGRRPGHRRQLHPADPADLLVVPVHDRPGGPHDDLRRTRPVGHPQGSRPGVEVVGVGRRSDTARPGLREQLGLDLHRGRPSAVDRLRPDDHVDRRLAVGQHR